MNVRQLLRPVSLVGISGVVLTAATLSTAFKRHLMASNSAAGWKVVPYVPQHASWPYNPSDFARHDSSSDASFYSAPRFVTHIDDAAIAALRRYYDAALPRTGRILDFCSSWVSHYPPAVEQAAARGELKITGMGMNQAELDVNLVLNHGRIVHDLNTDPDICAALARNPSDESAGTSEVIDGIFDASTNVVSTDYLTDPVAVLRSLRAATRQGGTVHLAISNRCFPTKAIGRWLRAREAERLEMVGDFLHFAGWKGIEIVELSDGTGSTTGLMGALGMSRQDPLWVVRAVKE